MSVGTDPVGQCEVCGALVVTYKRGNMLAYHNPRIHRLSTSTGLDTKPGAICPGSGLSTAGMERIGDVSGPGRVWIGP